MAFRIRWCGRARSRPSPDGTAGGRLDRPLTPSGRSLAYIQFRSARSPAPRPPPRTASREGSPAGKPGMKPAPFARHVPRSLDEALKILSDVAGDDGRILAGGQSLVPIMAFRLAKPAHLVDINEVEGLDKLADDGKALSIGARVRHAAFHKPVTANPLGALLAYVARHIAHYPIRMRGTFCGSLAHADPSSVW